MGLQVGPEQAQGISDNLSRSANGGEPDATHRRYFDSWKIVFLSMYQKHRSCNFMCVLLIY